MLKSMGEILKNFGEICICDINTLRLIGEGDRYFIHMCQNCKAIHRTAKVDLTKEMTTSTVAK